MLSFGYAAFKQECGYRRHCEAAYAHNAVAEFVPVTVALNKILKISGAACCCQEKYPKNIMALANTVSLNGNDAVIDQDCHKEYGTENLHQTDKTIGAEKTGVVSGTVDYEFHRTEKQQKN